MKSNLADFQNSMKIKKCVSCTNKPTDTYRSTKRRLKNQPLDLKKNFKNDDITRSHINVKHQLKNSTLNFKSDLSLQIKT